MTVPQQIKILESNVHPAGVTPEAVTVEIVTDRDKPGMEQRKYPLDKIAGLNAVAPKTGKVCLCQVVSKKIGSQ